MASPVRNLASNLTRVVARISLALAIAAASLTAFAQSSAANAHRQPVLVELFTSEGCSDCPPADALLAKLDSTQFIPGAQAIVLSEHVTYWNHLGWRDPFSFDAMDERQHQYSSHFGLDEVYTPQMVVDGRLQLVGGDAAALGRAVSSAASSPKLPIAIGGAHWASGSVLFSAHAQPNSKTRFVAALAEDATHSEVARGENAGRTLHHVSVIRVLKEFDSKSADGRPLSLAEPPLSSADKQTGPLRLVVFLADRDSGHVLAVAEQNITR